MNSIELAELLFMKGHRSVIENKGVDIELALLGLNPSPINNAELIRLAEQEGYVLTKDGWIKERILNNVKNRRGMIK